MFVQFGLHDAVTICRTKASVFPVDLLPLQSVSRSLCGANLGLRGRQIGSASFYEVEKFPRNARSGIAKSAFECVF